MKISCITRALRVFIVASAFALTSTPLFAGNTWDGGGGSPFNWSNSVNWSGDTQPGYGTLTFSGAVGTTNVMDQSYSMNQINWGGTSAWTMNSSNGAVLSLFDFGGTTQAKVESLGSGGVTINAPITFAATQGPNFGEINASTGNITFGSTATLTVNGSAIQDIRLYGNKILTFNNTVSASGRDFGVAGTAGVTTNIGGSFTADNFSVMNGGILNLNSGGTLNSTGIRLGSDYVGSTNLNNTLGATFALTSLTGGQTVAGVINTGTGASPGSNTSGALLVDSQNTSGTNTITGNIFLDSDLKIRQAALGTLSITNATLDLKNQTLTLVGATTGTYNMNITGVIGNSTGSGKLTIGIDGTSSTGVVTLSNANTYTGDTKVFAGTLAFTSLGSSNSSTIRLGATTGSATAQINLVTLTGGTTINSTINPVAGGTGVLTLNSQNTSGTNTYGGHIGMDRNFTITQSLGGTLNITQARAGGGSTTTGTDIKNFTLTLSGVGSTAGNTGVINFTGDIYNQLATSGILRIGGGTIATGVAVTLSGANTYSGGTNLDTNSLININSATALGTGALALIGNGTIDNTSGAPITLTNNNAINLSGGSLTFTGTNNLSFGSGAVTMSVASRSITTTAGTLTVGGIGQDATPRNFTKSGAGTLQVQGNSTYTGTTTISASGGTLKLENNGTTTTGKLAGTTGITVNASGTLLLSGSSSVVDRLNDAATMTLNGGTFNTGGLSEGSTATAGVGALTLQNNSFIDLGAGASILHFADSSGATWTASRVLEIDNWTGSPIGGGTDQLIFGTTSGGLTAGQIAEVQFLNPSGFAAGTYGAMILANGEVVPIPEPSTWVAGGLTLIALFATQRKRLARIMHEEKRARSLPDNL